MLLALLLAMLPAMLLALLLAMLPAMLLELLLALLGALHGDSRGALGLRRGP